MLVKKVMSYILCTENYVLFKSLVAKTCNISLQFQSLLYFNLASAQAPLMTHLESDARGSFH